MRMKKYLLIIVLGMVLFPTVNVITVSGAAGTVTWSPTEPEPDDVVLIEYNAAGGPLEGMSDVEMWWYMTVEGTKNNAGGIPPSHSMWPAGTTAPSLSTNWLYAKSPMTETFTNNWEVNITWDDIADSVVIQFKSGATTDNNDGDKWEIDSALKGEQIGSINAAFSCPMFAVPGDTKHIFVNASPSATSWDLFVEGKLDSPLSLAPTATFNAVTGLWDLEVTIPSDLHTMLYDLRYTATINGNARFRSESHALKVLGEYKTDYNFVVLADPQHIRDGTYPPNRDASTGDGNLSKTMTEVNHINPEFVIVLGDITEWTDEVAMHNAKKWYTQYLNVPLFLVPGNHDEFELTGTSGSGEYGSGLGVYLRIFGGLPYMKFSYGTHHFVSGFSDDQQMDPNGANPGPYAQAVWDHITDSLASPPAGTSLSFFMLHHPLSPNYYGSGESVDMTTELLNLMNTHNVDYFLHGHLHRDRYDVYDGTVHIGTDNAVGLPSTSGIRIIEMSGDTMTRFSHGPVQPGLYNATSYPLLQINATYESSNDGTASSNTAYLSNGFNTSLPNAKVTFAMAPSGAMMRYKSDDGAILDTWVQDGIQYVEVGVELSAMTNMSINIFQQQVPTTEETTTTTTSTTDETVIPTTGDTTTEETTDDGAPAVPLGFILSVITTVVVIRRSRKK